MRGAPAPSQHVVWDRRFSLKSVSKIKLTLMCICTRCIRVHAIIKK